MVYHVLNGDALAWTFPSDRLDGQVIIIREAFMEGPVSDDFDPAYWERRAAFVAEQFDADKASYLSSFGSQLRLLEEVRSQDTVYLWFEDDLFCQVNMWFAIHYILKKSKPSLYRVFPEEDEVPWRGFGKADKDSLLRQYEHASELWNGDIRLIQKLWKAYVAYDFERLTALGNTATTCIRYLPAIIHAHRERFLEDETQRQPGKLLHEIIAEGHTGFEDIFAQVSHRAGIYGFGDTQIRNILSAPAFTGQLSQDDPPGQETPAS